MPSFDTTVLIRFRHCDPAGIVFYPRYFEILNDLVEDWFAAIGWDFAGMLAGAGVAIPLVAVETTFLRPSRLGETLRATIEVLRLGRTSCAMRVTLSGADGAERVRFLPTMVCVRRNEIASCEWPTELREALQGLASSG